MAYTEQISFLLFLKMAHERTKPPHNERSIVQPSLASNRAECAQEPMHACDSRDLRWQDRDQIQIGKYTR